METPKIFESEYRFCLIMWENEPVNSTELVKLCKQQLGWSKATTYTVIRRLAERGVLKNENAIVTSLISKEEAQASRLNEMVEETFEGSMPAFIAAFSRSKKLSRREVDQLKQLIDSYEEG
ncbi:MAG: BlaI/MecI/CopY family transcriptional regulator [Oscillospiraceae bacterium]|nr:BlaI/MecI/CopY family transcriptional regulator [Oscillospiraceae bacterium]